uniref:Lebercilin domain-containing protein n=1 Tax=Ascaris lumbricoides TaxID=6252 RepID=A0A9J2PY02_ASCLU
MCTEAKLTEKCERLCERVRQSGIDQNTIREQRSTIKFLQADLQACQQRLALSEGKLADMQNKLYNVHDYDSLKEENMKLRFEIENGVTAERLKAKEVEVANLERRLKLVEEAAILRVRELNLQLKLVADKLEKKSAECRRYRLSNPPSENVVVMPPSRTEQSRQQALSLSESLSSPSTNSSSSFDRNLRNRLKNLDHLSKQLDVSLEKYRSRRHQHSRVHQRPLLTSHQMNMKATEPRRNHSEVRVAVPEVVQQDEVVVPEVMRQDEVVVPEVMPQVALSTSVKPLMTSTPLSTMDEKVTEVNVDRLTPLHETSAEAAMGNSTFPPIAFPSNKTKQNDGNKLSEQRGEILPNADVPEENSFEQRLRRRSERLRAMSAAESEQVEKQGDERSEENPVMQQYMSIITQQRQEEAEEDKAEDNSQNVDVSLEDLHMDRGEVNSASEFDW